MAFKIEIIPSVNIGACRKEELYDFDLVALRRTHQDRGGVTRRVDVGTCAMSSFAT